MLIPNLVLLQYLLKPVDLQALYAALTVDLKRRFENRPMLLSPAAPF